MSIAWMCLLSFIAGAGIATWDKGLYKRILKRKGDSEHKTPEKIGDAFYYIVPEDEYVWLDSLRLSVKQQHEMHK